MVIVPTATKLSAAVRTTRREQVILGRVVSRAARETNKHPNAIIATSVGTLARLIRRPPPCDWLSEEPGFASRAAPPPLPYILSPLETSRIYLAAAGKCDN